MTTLYDNLNARQRQAVTWDEAGLMVLAGAGTGKTRVLTDRIIHLLTENRASPRNILAVTFTNKAATEMRNRIETALPTPLGGLMLGTFHSVSHRLLRIHATTAGLDKNFQILDTQDQLTFLRRLMREQSIDEKEFSPAEVRHYISTAKEAGARAVDAPVHNQRMRHLADIYMTYEAACRRENKLDFAELILATIDLWRSQEELRSHYARRFRHILIDELQDTNRQQFDWLKQLDSGDNHFFAVGDDDQSIYAFRGAEPAIMKRFQSELRAHQLIRLEENYRSVGHILNAANQLITANQNRLGKTLTTTKGIGSPINICATDDQLQEATIVAQLISQHLQSGGAAEDIAILYRTNAQARLFERELMESGIPYRIFGGLRFYDRMEVKHAIAYLRLLEGEDKDALLRVINMPPRGIGEKAVNHLLAEDDLFHALQVSTHQKVVAFRTLLAHCRRTLQSASLGELTRTVIEASGLLAHYEERKEQERVENLHELVNAATQFEINSDNADDEISPLSAFLSTVALESAGEESDHSQRTVSLMTVHAAKGLEFNQVFVVGMEEGLFPHAQSIDSGRARDVEEERRLLYVAITRARQRLSLCFARQRMLYGRTTYNVPSRFLDELPPDCLANQQWQSSASASSLSTTVKARSWREKPSLPSAPSVRFDDGRMRAGDAVIHQRYGQGVVLKRIGSGAALTVEVMFKSAGIKSFNVALAPLKKVSS